MSVPVSSMLQKSKIEEVKQIWTSPLDGNKLKTPQLLELHLELHKLQDDSIIMGSFLRVNELHMITFNLFGDLNFGKCYLSLLDTTQWITCSVYSSSLMAKNDIKIKNTKTIIESSSNKNLSPHQLYWLTLKKVFSLS